MLTTPAGTSDVSSTDRSRSRASGCAARGHDDDALPIAIAGATSETKPSSGASSGQTTPITPHGSFIASVTKRVLRRVHRAVVFVGPAGVEEQPRGSRRRPRRAPRARRRRSCARSRAANSARARVEVLGDVVEHLRAVVRGRRAPAGRLAPRPRRRCGCPCGCPGRPGRASGPCGSSTAVASSRNRGAPACRRYRVLAVRSMPSAPRRRRRPGRGARGCEPPCAGLPFGARRRRQIFGQALAPALAAEAALAIAAEAGGGVEQVGRIDPDDAGLDARGDFERAVDVLAPDRGGEAVARVVGERDRLVGRAEASSSTSTGPKISSRASIEAGSTSVTSVGG